MLIPPKKSLQSAKKRLREIDRLISKPIIAPFGTATKLDPVVTEFKKTNLLKLYVKLGVHYRGDIMQVVLSQRMNVAFDAEPLAYIVLLELSTHLLTCFFSICKFFILLARRQRY